MRRSRRRSISPPRSNHRRSRSPKRQRNEYQHSNHSDHDRYDEREQRRQYNDHDRNNGYYDQERERGRPFNPFQLASRWGKVRFACFMCNKTNHFPENCYRKDAFIASAARGGFVLEAIQNTNATPPHIQATTNDLPTLPETKFSPLATVCSPYPNGPVSVSQSDFFLLKRIKEQEAAAAIAEKKKEQTNELISIIRKELANANPSREKKTDVLDSELVRLRKAALESDKAINRMESQFSIFQDRLSRTPVTTATTKYNNNLNLPDPQQQNSQSSQESQSEEFPSQTFQLNLTPDQPLKRLSISPRTAELAHFPAPLSAYKRQVETTYKQLADMKTLTGRRGKLNKFIGSQPSAHKLNLLYHLANKCNITWMENEIPTVIANVVQHF